MTRTPDTRVSSGLAPFGESSPTKSWLGPDVHSLNKVTVPPGGQDTIPIGLADLQQVIPPDYRRKLTIVGRSRFAQLGGDILPEGATIIANALEHMGPDAAVPIPVTNHSAAPLVIPEGPVARLIVKGDPLTGEALKERIGKFAIGGEEGEDWWIHGGSAIGLLLENTEFWIPPRRTPIVTNGDTGSTFRQELDQAMMPFIPGRDDLPGVLIGQTTATLGLPEDILGFIDPDIDTAPDGVLSVNPNHLSARGLYGNYNGGSAWPIRTETIPPQHNGFNRKAIIVTFSPV